MTWFVYAFVNIVTGMIKFGITTNVKTRLAWWNRKWGYEWKHLADSLAGRYQNAKNWEEMIEARFAGQRVLAPMEIYNIREWQALDVLNNCTGFRDDNPFEPKRQLLLKFPEPTVEPEVVADPEPALQPVILKYEPRVDTIIVSPDWRVA